jgi:hypothetical protein
MGLCFPETCKLEWRSAEPTEKRKLIAKPLEVCRTCHSAPSHCSSMLCPLTPMLTPRPKYVVSFPGSMNISALAIIERCRFRTKMEGSVRPKNPPPAWTKKLGQCHFDVARIFRSRSRLLSFSALSFPVNSLSFSPSSFCSCPPTAPFTKHDQVFFSR